MTLLTVAPFTMKDCTFIVETDDYARHVSSVKFTPTIKQDDIEWQGLTPDATFTDESAPVETWTCDLAFAQDWETDDSLSDYLLTNAGLTKTVQFDPKKGTGNTRFTADVTIVPPPIGGDVKTVAVGTVSMKSTRPVSSVAP